MRLIDADAVKKALTEAHINMTLTFDIATFNCVMNTIDNAPTVDPENLIKPIANVKVEITEEEKQRIIEMLREKPKFVKWEYIGGDSVEVYRCSCCGCFSLDNERECKNCSMPEEKKEKK